MSCVQCEGHGLIRVNYQSGEPYDVVICICQDGRFWRKGGVSLVRQLLNLSEDHQVGLLEDVDGEAPAMTPPPDFIAAGRVGKKAKL